MIVDAEEGYTPSVFKIIWDNQQPIRNAIDSKLKRKDQQETLILKRIAELKESLMALLPSIDSLTASWSRVADFAERLGLQVADLPVHFAEGAHQDTLTQLEMLYDRYRAVLQEVTERCMSDALSIPEDDVMEGFSQEEKDALSQKVADYLQNWDDELALHLAVGDEHLAYIEELAGRVDQYQQTLSTYPQTQGVLVGFLSSVLSIPESKHSTNFSVGASLSRFGQFALSTLENAGLGQDDENEQVHRQTM